MHVAKIEFGVENKALNASEFPRLKLSVGEKARISIVETAPEFAYVHTLRKPVLGDDGKFVMETRTNKRGTYQVATQEFVGQHFCFGDTATLVKSGSDPDNCPTCKASLEVEGITRPDRRFAMHVLQYVCQPNSFNPVMPLSLRLVVWTFGDRRYNEMADLAEAWKEHGGLRFRDIELGPCQAPEVFQKFDMRATPGSVWTSKDEWKQLGIATYKEQQVPNLEDCIARRATQQQAAEDIAKVADAYAIGNGKKPHTLEHTAGTADIAASVASILDGASPEDPADPAAFAGLDEAFAGIKTDTPAVATVNGAGKPDEAQGADTAHEETADGGLDFDALLSGLNS